MFMVDIWRSGDPAEHGSQFSDWPNHGSHTDRRLYSAKKSVSFHSRSFEGSATRTDFRLEHQTYSDSAKIGKSIKLKLPFEGSDSVQMTAVVL